MTEANGTEHRGQLLVIDDEDEIVRALKRQFRKKYDVHIANSAKQGYDIMRRLPIHVIILDQRMPEVTGTDFFESLRKEFPDSVRLILTGYADIKAVIATINDGNVFRYITKPWDPEELDSIVEQAFDHYFLIKRKQALMNELVECNHVLDERVRLRTSELEEANAQLLELKPAERRIPRNGGT